MAEALSKANNKKISSHKRTRKKRTAIPVATPKVPTLAGMPGSGGGMANFGDGIVGLNYSMKDDKNWRVDPTERGTVFYFIKHIVYLQLKSITKFTHRLYIYN